MKIRELLITKEIVELHGGYVVDVHLLTAVRQILESEVSCVEIHAILHRKTDLQFETVSGLLEYCRTNLPKIRFIQLVASNGVDKQVTVKLIVGKYPEGINIEYRVERRAKKPLVEKLNAQLEAAQIPDFWKIRCTTHMLYFIIKYGVAYFGLAYVGVREGWFGQPGKFSTMLFDSLVLIIASVPFWLCTMIHLR
jgi:hypothetical protein